MNNENKKSCKKRGMTLVEVIISIAVMAVLALLLTTIGVTVDNYRKDTKAKNQKIATESPVAEVQDRDKGVGSSGKGKLVEEEYNITVSANGDSVNVKGKLYSTNEELTDTGSVDADGEPIYDGNISKHFKFVYIKP